MKLNVMLNKTSTRTGGTLRRPHVVGSELDSDSDSDSDTGSEDHATSLISILDLSSVEDEINGNDDIHNIATGHIAHSNSRYNTTSHNAGYINTSTGYSDSRDTVDADCRRHRIPIDFLLTSTAPPMPVAGVGSERQHQKTPPYVPRTARESLLYLIVEPSRRTSKSKSKSRPIPRPKSSPRQPAQRNKNTDEDVANSKAETSVSPFKNRKQLATVGMKLTSPKRPVLDPIGLPKHQKRQRVILPPDSRNSIFNYFKKIFWRSPVENVPTVEKSRIDEVASTIVTEQSPTPSKTTQVDPLPESHSIEKHAQQATGEIQVASWRPDISATSRHRRKVGKRKTQSVRQHKYLVKQKRIIRIANSSSSASSTDTEEEEQQQTNNNTTWGNPPAIATNAEHSLQEIPHSEHQSLLDPILPSGHEENPKAWRNESESGSELGEAVAHPSFVRQNVHAKEKVIQLSESDSDSDSESIVEEHPWPGLYSQYPAK